MDREMVCKVDAEDLERWRELMARKSAIELTNAVPSVEEAAGVYGEHYRLAGEMIEKYDIDDAEDWNISVFSGNLYYIED